MSSSSFRSGSSSSISSTVILPSVSVDVSNLHVHTSSLSSSTTFQSMPNSVVITRSSSVSTIQHSVSSSFSSLTQLYSNVLPTPSMSEEVFRSTVIKSTELISTRSILLLSKVLTYTYSMPSPTSVVVNTATTSNDMTVAALPTDVTSTSTKYTLFTSATADVTGNKMTSSPNNPSATTTDDNGNTLSAIPTAVTSNSKGKRFLLRKVYLYSF